MAAAATLVTGSALAVAGRGASPVVGTWVNAGSFSYPSPGANGSGTAQVVTKLFVKGDGTWRLLDPTINSDGTTTPHSWSGTYSTDGDTVHLQTEGSPFATAVLSGDKLTVTGSGTQPADALVFTRQ
jgi:hypothetical protein